MKYVLAPPGAGPSPSMLGAIAARLRAMDSPIAPVWKIIWQKSGVPRRLMRIRWHGKEVPLRPNDTPGQGGIFPISCHLNARFRMRPFVTDFFPFLTSAALRAHWQAAVSGKAKPPWQASARPSAGAGSRLAARPAIQVSLEEGCGGPREEEGPPQFSGAQGGGEPLETFWRWCSAVEFNLGHAALQRNGQHCRPALIFPHGMAGAEKSGRSSDEQQ